MEKNCTEIYRYDREKTVPPALLSCVKILFHSDFIEKKILDEQHFTTPFCNSFISVCVFHFEFVFHFKSH